MKRVITASIVALTIGSTAATADVKVGLGFGIDAMSSLSGIFTAPGGMQSSVRVPIDFDFGLRIEPDVVFGAYTREQDYWMGGTEERVTTIAGLGVGAYYTLWKRDKLNFYAGGRLGYASYNSETTYSNGTPSNESGENRVNLQGLFGAEYYFVEEMSFAAQVGLDAYYGKGTGNDSDEETSGLGTTSTLILRYFF